MLAEALDHSLSCSKRDEKRCQKCLRVAFKVTSLGCRASLRISVKYCVTAASSPNSAFPPQAISRPLEAIKTGICGGIQRKIEGKTIERLGFSTENLRFSGVSTLSEAPRMVP